MRFIYADPPYFGCCKLYDHHHPDGRCWDDLETHRLLIERIDAESDGWAMSLSSPSLQRILPLCPADVRVAAWVKPFCSFKPNVNPAYAWEPVIFKGGRDRERLDDTVRDWVSCNITLQKGLTGAKPWAFAFWIFDLLNVSPDDDFADLFPGSGAVTDAWERYRAAGIQAHQNGLFARNAAAVDPLAEAGEESA